MTANRRKKRRSSGEIGGAAGTGADGRLASSSGLGRRARVRGGRRAAGAWLWTSRPWGRDAARPNVLLVTIDTLRWDRLGCYGYRGGTSPTLDALARRGTRFETAIAQAPLTAPSHASILTGLTPLRHGVRDNGAFVLPDTLPTLASRLKAAGYATAAFVSGFPLDHRFGFATGFDTYDDRLPRGAPAAHRSYSERRADAHDGPGPRLARATAGRPAGHGRRPEPTVVHVGALLRPARGLRAACGVRRALRRPAVRRRGGVRRCPARPAVPAVGPAGRHRAHAGARDGRPWGEPRRSRRGDARRLRLRCHRARALHRGGSGRARWTGGAGRGTGRGRHADAARPCRGRASRRSGRPLAAGRARGRRDGRRTGVRRVADGPAQSRVGSPSRAAQRGLEVHRRPAAGTVRPRGRPRRAQESRRRPAGTGFLDGPPARGADARLGYAGRLRHPRPRDRRAPSGARVSGQRVGRGVRSPPGAIRRMASS